MTILAPVPPDTPFNVGGRCALLWPDGYARPAALVRETKKQYVIATGDTHWRYNKNNLNKPADWTDTDRAPRVVPHDHPDVIAHARKRLWYAHLADMIEEYDDYSYSELFTEPEFLASTRKHLAALNQLLADLQGPSCNDTPPADIVRQGGCSCPSRKDNKR